MMTKRKKKIQKMKVELANVSILNSFENLFSKFDPLFDDVRLKIISFEKENTKKGKLRKVDLYLNYTSDNYVLWLVKYVIYHDSNHNIIIVNDPVIEGGIYSGTPKENRCPKLSKKDIEIIFNQSQYASMSLIDNYLNNLNYEGGYDI